MDMVYVYKFKKEKNINIHYWAQHYEEQGNILTARGEPLTKIKKIKTRYLQMMRQQLENQHPESFKEAEDKLSITDMNKLEKQLQEGWAKHYNEQVQTIENQANINTYIDASTKFGKLIKNLNQPNAINEAYKQLDRIYTLYSGQSVDTLGLFKTVKDKWDYAAKTDVGQLLNLKNFLNQLNNQTKSKTSSQWDVSNWTTASEISTIMPLLSKDWSDKAIQDAIKNKMIGTRPNPVSVKFDYTNESKNMVAKAADAKIERSDLKWTGKTVTFQRTTTVSEKRLAEKTVMTFPNIIDYASIKTYRTDSDLHFVSYSGKNSFFSEAIAQIYNLTNKTKYQIYNALAFKQKYESTGSELDQNFRIIRRDLSINFAEKFLVGIDPNQAQRILVYNFRAIPMITIIDAIIEDMIKRIGDGNDPNSLSRGAFFSISFSKYNVTNKWVTVYNKDGKKLGASPEGKMRRIKRTINQINKIKMQGKLQQAKLEELARSAPGILNNQGSVQIGTP